MASIEGDQSAAAGKVRRTLDETLSKLMVGSADQARPDKSKSTLSELGSRSEEASISEITIPDKKHVTEEAREATVARFEAPSKSQEEESGSRSRAESDVASLPPSASQAGRPPEN